MWPECRSWDRHPVRRMSSQCDCKACDSEKGLFTAPPDLAWNKTASFVNFSVLLKPSSQACFPPLKCQVRFPNIRVLHKTVSKKWVWTAIKKKMTKFKFLYFFSSGIITQKLITAGRFGSLRQQVCGEKYRQDKSSSFHSPPPKKPTTVPSAEKINLPADLNEWFGGLEGLWFYLFN